METRMSIRAIIFDFGSVINCMVDETPRQQLAERYGIPLDTIYQQVFESPTAVPACLGHLTIGQHWEAVLDALDIPSGERADFIRQFWSADGLNTELVDYIRSVLKPHYKIGLLSNAWDDLRRVLHERWGVAHDFDDLIISAEVHDAKPNASIYRLALDRLGVGPEEAVFIDDMPENVAGAQAVGMAAIQYRDFEQTRSELEALLNGGSAAREQP
jgi:HAD superfamily hydrolase (TIGR01549 family)